MHRLLPLLLIVPLAAACSESHGATDGGTDATIRFDAPPPDAGTDASGGDGGVLPGEGEVGASCSADAECEAGACITELPGGYCSGLCATDDDCPEGSACVQVNRRTSVCLDRCDPAGAPKQCREGYGCADSPFFPSPVCLPGCEVDADCPSGRRCDPAGGFGGAGQCYDPEAELGGACADEADCPAESFCLAEAFAGWPGGACIGVIDCDVEADTGCPGDAHCLPSRRGGTICIDGCATDDDCRAGYACRPVDGAPERRICQPACRDDSVCTEEGLSCYQGDGTCAPPFDASQLGEACSRRHGACIGGTCLSEFEAGMPGSYCAYLGCDPTAADAEDGCPGQGVCWQPEADGSALCMAPCDDPGDCREGYACRQVDPDRPERGSACLPACTSDAQCVNDGFRCDTERGVCTPPAGG